MPPYPAFPSSGHEQVYSEQLYVWTKDILGSVNQPRCFQDFTKRWAAKQSAFMPNPDLRFRLSCGKLLGG
jgi:hypothetical protein